MRMYVTMILTVTSNDRLSSVYILSVPKPYKKILTIVKAKSNV